MPQEGKIKVAFFGKLTQTFIKKDYEILSKSFDVEVIEPPRDKGEWLKYPGRVKKLVKKSDVVFGWFAGWHTLPGVYYAKRYRKKSIIVVGGYDAAYVPEIGYGAFTNIKEKIPAKYVLKNADLLLAVSQLTKKDVLKRVKPKKIIVVYNGVDIEKFKPRGKKENIVLSIAVASNLRRVKIKGLDIFVKSARYLPEVNFIVIGVSNNAKKYLQKLASNNVELLEFIPNDKIVTYYQRAKVFAQLSYYEAFGLALAESMACGCVPVLTKDRIGIAEIVEDLAFYVPYGDAKATAEAIKKALETPEEWGGKAREKIMKFSAIEKRENELIKIVREVFNKN